MNLKDVKAFKSAIKRKPFSTTGLPTNKQSEYNNEKSPCDSCQVFFDRYELTLDNLHTRMSFPPFGNCAEYDVIRTNNLDSVLLDLANKTEHWALFETACQHHFKVFNELTKSLNVAEDLAADHEKIKQYYKDTNNAKILRYKRFGVTSLFTPQFTLVAESWPSNKKRSTKKKRRKTAA